MNRTEIGKFSKLLNNEIFKFSNNFLNFFLTVKILFSSR